MPTEKNLTDAFHETLKDIVYAEKQSMRGHIDLLVREGFYSNRAYFIRTAIRNQLDRHTAVVRQSVARNALDLGLRHYSRADLEGVRNATCWTRDR